MSWKFSILKWIGECFWRVFTFILEEKFHRNCGLSMFYRRTVFQFADWWHLRFGQKFPTIIRFSLFIQRIEFKNDVNWQGSRLFLWGWTFLLRIMKNLWCESHANQKHKTDAPILNLWNWYPYDTTYQYESKSNLFLCEFIRKFYQSLINGTTAEQNSSRTNETKVKNDFSH